MTNKTHSDTDIAIIGMSCRLPGNNNSPEEFWEFLLNKGDGIKVIPRERWDYQTYFDADREKKGKLYIDRGGFIDDIDQFDPQFFGISPKEAPFIDPQHRWLLELTHEAIENAGLVSDNLKGSDTAVYIGQFMSDYEQLQLDSRAHRDISNHTATGLSKTLTSNRISYLFNFIGPSVTLDTACSSSLVALDMACKALLNGESKLAVAGGVNILLRPEVTMSICKASMLSSDGYCKSFDASANGYARSEGGAIVLVKKLNDAIADGEKVLAVIKATGVNQDGQTVGITAPNGDSQELLFKKTLERAKLQADDIQYIEAHGTGTALGDPIEVNALGNMVGKRSTDKKRCIIGSVKSNIGHTEATAGMAGLIKTVMAMNEGVIPSNIHLNEVNPAIDQEALNIQLASQQYDWPDTDTAPRAALVNSFGFGGTNSNVVLQQAPAASEQGPAKRTDNQHYFLPISAKTEPALQSLAKKYKAFLSGLKGREDIPESALSLANICYSAATKRDHFAHRLVLNGSDKASLIQGVDAYLNSQPDQHYTYGKQQTSNQKICFVFSGMGPQWANMGKELYVHEPVFADKLRDCDEAIGKLTGWSILDKLFHAKQSNEIDQTDIAQPAIFSIQVSLAYLFKSRGIEPACIVGHSVGEVAAAHVAGALSFDDAVTVIYHRSRLQHTTQGMGKMLAVGVTEDALKPYLNPFNEQVSIAAINSATSLTLSGDESALKNIEQALDSAGEFARFLNVDVPYHGPAMTPLKAPLIEALDNIQVQTPHTTLYSTVTGQLSTGTDWSATYWADNVREPVLFKHAIENIADAVSNSFVEIAPHTVLSKNISNTLNEECTVVATLKRDQDDLSLFHQALATLHVTGIGVNWPMLVDMNSQFVSLPNYAWQHQSYWNEAEATQQARLFNSGHAGNLLDAVHPLLGHPVNSTLPIWNKQISLDELAYLQDHQIENEVVYPGAAYIEMGLGIARHCYQKEHVSLENVLFNKALFLPEEQTLTLECHTTLTNQSFEINALDDNTNTWEPVSNGVISDALVNAPERLVDLSALIAKLPNIFTKSDFYKHCHRLGLSYQTQFQVVERIWHSDRESLVEVCMPDGVNGDGYFLHPIMLDGAFQSLFATINQGYLPVKIGQFNYYRTPDKTLYCHLTTDSKTDQHIQGSLTLFDECGVILAELSGIELKAIQPAQTHEGNQLLYDYHWKMESLPHGDAPQTSPRKWVLFTDRAKLANPLANLLSEHFQENGDEAILYIVSYGDEFAQLGQHRYQIDLQRADHYQKLVQHLDKDIDGILYWASIDTAVDWETISSDAVFEQSCNTTSALMYLSQALNQCDWSRALDFFLYTQSAHQLEQHTANPIQATLWGFARVLANEHPELNISLIDLPMIMNQSIYEQIGRILVSKHYEQESALRSTGRFVHRLRASDDTSLRQYSTIPTLTHEAQSYMIHTEPKPYLQAQIRSSTLTSNQVAIHVDYINDCYREVVTLTGTVAQTGQAVYKLNSGDRVIARAKQTANSWMLLDQSQVARLSDTSLASLNNEEAATLGHDFIIAMHCINNLTELKAGQRILIHNAATPLGLAFAQLGQQRDATVLATVNNTKEASWLRQQTDLLQSNIAFCGDFDFVNQFGESQSGNEGIDVVINYLPVSKLASQFANKTAQLMSENGFFIELNQCPVVLDQTFSNILFDKNISYHTLNSALISAKSLDAETGLFHSLLSTDLIMPLPHCKYAAEDTESWSEHKDTSKLIVLDTQNKQVEALPELTDNPIKAEKSYVVTGGLGGLGLELMKWLVEHGATSIILLGRSAAKPAAQSLIQGLQNDRVKIHVRQADVSNEREIQQIVDEIQQTMPPLAGIIHAAGVLRDGVIAHQSFENVQTVFAPKIKGCWNLHRATSEIALDFFINFSSIAAVLGWAGQSNYAAANAFLDAYAHHQNSCGKMTLSINWGPWGDAGMAANLDDKDQQRMQESGMHALSNVVAMDAMRTLLKHRMKQAGVFELDWTRIMKQYPNPAQKTVFSEFYQGGEQDGGSSFIEQFRQADIAQKKSLLVDTIRTLAAQALAIETVDSIESQHNLFEYGFDSLMAMEFKIKLQATLQCKLSNTLVLKYPTIDAMSQYIIDHVLSSDVDIAASNESRLTLWNPDQPEHITACAISGELPLTPIVSYWHKQNLSKHFNVGFLLQSSDEKFDLATLETTMSVLLEYHDATRIQITEHADTIRQTVLESVGRVTIKSYDFSKLGYEEGVTKMQEINQQLHNSFEFREGVPLYRMAHYKLNDEKPHRFFIIFHHYLSDGFSQRIFAQTLQSVYLSIYKKQSVELPAKSVSIIDWNKRMHRFAYEEAVSQIPYWQKILQQSEACYIQPEVQQNRDRQVADCVTLKAKLNTEYYQQLVTLCRHQQFELTDIAIYALLKAFSRNYAKPALWLDLFVFGRNVFEQLDSNHLFGQISEYGCILFDISDEEGDVFSILNSIRQQRLSVPSSGVGLKALKYLNTDEEVVETFSSINQPQVVLNFDPQIYQVDETKTGFNVAKESVGEKVTRVVEDDHVPPFYIKGMVRQDQLLIELAYYQDLFTNATAENVLQVIIDTFYAVLEQSIELNSEQKTA